MTAPLRFRKRPVVIEAMQYQPDRIGDIWDWAGADNIYGPVENDSSAYIMTLEGRMEAKPGDWIIRGVQGEFYPCKPDIFDATYEAADPPADRAAEWRRDLTRLINRNGMESGSDTPDWLLAQYLTQSLIIFDAAVASRDSWYGITPLATSMAAALAKPLDEHITEVAP